MIAGHCQCGLISFEADAEITDFGHCHCSICRRLNGGPFATFAAVDADKFRYLSGEKEARAYQSSPGVNRVFCSNCGSSILVVAEVQPKFVYLCMSAVEGNPDHPPAYHEFVGSKAPWYEITDDLPQHQGSVHAAEE